MRPRTGPEKPTGITPMTVYTAPFSRISLPITSGSPPKLRRQNAFETTTTRTGAPIRSSEATKPRPSDGGTPSTSK
jgi:hypothetical protein